MRADLSQPAERRPELALVVAVAGGLYVGIFALRLLVDDPPALIANFYTVPTVLLAVAYGIRAGLLGAAISAALVVLWHVVEPVDVSTLGYVTRVGVVLLAGTVVGYYSERLRADIARRRVAESELALHAEDLVRTNERLEQAVRRLDALATIARAAGTETDLHRSLARIVAQGRELAGGAALAVWVRREGEEDVRVAGHGRGTIVVPLEYRGELLGTLTASPVEGQPEPDPDLLGAVAASAAAAIVTARSVSAEHLRGAIEASERERSRWAWELHDETLQSLVGLRVLLSSALRSGRPELLARTVEDALEELALETSNLKHLIAELRPAALDELGLEAALSDLCDRVAATSGADISASIELAGRVAPELETTVYRVAQEALTNVGKHAAAERATLTVRGRDHTIEIEVSDDGRGFDSQTVTAGLGLRGMTERVELGGGRLAVRSGPGGTCVVATLPIRRSATDQRPASPLTTT